MTRRNRHRSGGGAGFYAEFYVHVLQVFVHRAWAEAEDVADVAVGLAAGHPLQHFHFSFGEQVTAAQRRLGLRGAQLRAFGR